MHKLILASKSAARRKMLRASGLEFEIEPAEIDEEKILQEMQQKNMGAQQIAEALACTKAETVSLSHPYALVIGSDQILECEGKIFSKAKDKEAAKEKLKALRGKEHSLRAAVCIAFEGKTIWSHSERALLSMGHWSDEFLDRYCKSAGETLTSCVGAYAIETQGAWLFDKIDGDYFTILGMPLMPLLKFLREEYGFAP